MTTFVDLREKARAMGVPGYSRMKKGKLQDSITVYESLTTLERDIYSKFTLKEIRDLLRGRGVKLGDREISSANKLEMAKTLAGLEVGGESEDGADDESESESEPRRPRGTAAGADDAPPPRPRHAVSKHSRSRGLSTIALTSLGLACLGVGVWFAATSTSHPRRPTADTPPPEPTPLADRVL